MIIENNLSNEDDNGPTTSSLVSEILIKYNLGETPAEAAEKIMTGGDLPNSIVTQYLSRDFANNLISEKNFIDSLEKRLKISSEVAGNIVKEIIEKVVPYIRSISKNKFSAEKQMVTAPTRQANNEMGVEPPLATKIKENKPTITKNIIRPPENENIKKIPRTGPDSYREPIE